MLNTKCWRPQPPKNILSIKEPARVTDGLRRRDFRPPSRSGNEGIPDADGTPRSCAAEGGLKARRPAGWAGNAPPALLSHFDDSSSPESHQCSAAHPKHFRPIPVPWVTRTDSQHLEPNPLISMVCSTCASWTPCLANLDIFYEPSLVKWERYRVIRSMG